MRLHAAVMGVGIAILALTGVAAPAQAIDTSRLAQASPEDELAGWEAYAWYKTEGECHDAGQQLKREHSIRQYKCEDPNPGHYPPILMWVKW